MRTLPSETRGRPIRGCCCALVALPALLLLVLGAGASGAAPLEHPADGISPWDCADPEGEVAAGIPLALLCGGSDGTVMDDPIRIGSARDQVRAGALNALFIASHVGQAFGRLAPERIREILAMEHLGADLGVYRALRACGEVESGGAAASCAAQADALIAGKREQAVPELLATRVDVDRSALLDLDAPVPERADTVNGRGFSLGGPVLQPDVFTTPGGLDRAAFDHAVPFITGPNGRLGDADDLPRTRSRVAPGLTLSSEIPESTWSASRAHGFAGYTHVAFIDGRLDERAGFGTTGRPLILFGIVNPEHLRVSGCQVLGGASQEDGSCLDAGGGELDPARVHEMGCQRWTLSASRGGVNRDGDCLQLNVRDGSPLRLGGFPSTAGVHFDVAIALADLGFYPPEARLEPTNLTDFRLRGTGGRGLPARPRVSLNRPRTLGPARRADPLTGAPVRLSGPLECSLRPGGPNGVAGDADDGLASVGNCLLFDPPTSPGAPQALRSPSAIAADHPADQLLFHRLCSAGFDEDSGSCGLDGFNRDAIGTGELLSGSFGPVLGALLAGVDTIRPQSSPQLPPRSLNNLLPLLLAPLGATRSLDVSPEEAGLLGCGLHALAPCGAAGRLGYAGTPEFLALLGARNSVEIAAGLDLQLADASVLFQESPVLKALQAEGGVGRRGSGGDARFEAGIQSDGLDPEGVDGLGTAGRAALVEAGTPTDAWIEPFPWRADPEWLARGVIVFQVANALEWDPRCDPAGRPTDGSGVPEFSPAEQSYCTSRFASWTPQSGIFVPNDPSDETNPANVFESGGENCAPFNGVAGPSQTPAHAGEGCTKLELISSNYWRAEIAFALIGRDRAFDPPETVEELEAILSGDPDALPGGDPISGPDGIYTRNVRVFRDPSTGSRTNRNDVHAVPFRSATDLIDADEIAPTFDFDLDGSPDGADQLDLSRLSMRQFFAGFNPEAACPRLRCSLEVGEVDLTFTQRGVVPSIRPLGTVLPVAIEAELLRLDGQEPDSGLARPKINLLELFERDRVTFARLWSGQETELQGYTLRYARPDPRHVHGDAVLQLGPSALSSLRQNLDGDPGGVSDADQDGDGVYDGVDDDTRGPATDDSTFCGSGLPGDLLQDALQLELHSDEEWEKLETRFPDGLLPRSPVFCAGLMGALGLTGESEPGRRDFLWHFAQTPSQRDSDRDGVADDFDNCPFAANEDQADRGGVASPSDLPARVPDGIGDRCQCGDVSADGRVNGIDSTLIEFAEQGLGPFQSTADLPGADRCDVDLQRGCARSDALAIRHATLGLPDAVQQYCPAATATRD